METTPSLNPNIIIEASGGDSSIVQELVDLFLAQIPLDLHDLGSAIEKEDLDNIKKLAHKIKGSSAYFGAEYMVLCAKKIEEFALKKDLTSCKNHFQRLQEAYHKVTQAIPSTFL